MAAFKLPGSKAVEEPKSTPLPPPPPKAKKEKKPVWYPKRGDEVVLKRKLYFQNGEELPKGWRGKIFDLVDPRRGYDIVVIPDYGMRPDEDKDRYSIHSKDVEKI